MPTSILPVVSVLGLPYVNATPDQLRLHLSYLLTGSQTCAKIFTPNATIAAAAYKDASLQQLLRQATLLLPDGYGILLAAKLAGMPLSHRLTGIDTGETILSLCAAFHIPVYFLGAAPGVAKKAAAFQTEKFPTLRVAGCAHGYFSEQDHAAILQDIRRSGAQVVLVCLGFPKQERWIVHCAKALPQVRLMIGLGGSFDVWAGQVKRAPAVFRDHGLEWLWRSARKPSRLRTLAPAIPYWIAARRQGGARVAVATKTIKTTKNKKAK